MSLALINPTQILNAYRKSDAVIIVCQNNTKRMIEIAAVNHEAVRVMGYTNEDLVGKPLAMLLPERLGSTLTEFIEYGDSQHDLLAVLSKIRDFSVKPREGHEVQFRLRVIRGEAIDKNPWFHLVLVDEEQLRKNNRFREILKENFKGHEVIDERTGLPNRASLSKDLELVVYHVRSHEITASFAVIDINQYDRLRTIYSQQTCDRMHQHIGEVCKLKLRAEDTIGTLSEHSLGLVMVDAPQESARMVLNRLRWAIGSSPFQVREDEELLVHVNIAFAQMDGKISEAQLLEQCESFAAGLRGKVNNSVQLVVTHERRESPDRRVISLAVDKERRRKERRKD